MVTRLEFILPVSLTSKMRMVQHSGYWTSISKTYTPYPSGHIIYNPGHNTWLP